MFVINEAQLEYIYIYIYIYEILHSSTSFQAVVEEWPMCETLWEAVVDTHQGNEKSRHWI
jgi:hypothetical protein